jgi:NTP pyrophosphatase (non-canonical NTP hydrolase)
VTSDQFMKECRRTDTRDYGAVLDRMEHRDGMAGPLPNEKMLKLLHGIMGLDTEQGELMDALKKALIYGKPIDDVNILEEVGDSLWYQSLILDAIGKTFADAMDVNVQKLRARYPEKFTEAQALNRNLPKERRVLVDVSKFFGDTDER